MHTLSDLMSAADRTGCPLRITKRMMQRCQSWHNYAFWHNFDRFSIKIMLKLC